MFVNCSTEENEINSQDVAKSIDKVQLVNFGVNSENAKVPLNNNLQMLSFDSWKTFSETAEQLDVAVEQYDDAFLNTYTDLSEEELDSIEVQLNYNDQQPLINYEQSLGFTNSLRLRYNLEKEEFIEAGAEDPAIDPDLTLAFSGGELSLVNYNQQVMVDGVVYAIVDDGYVAISGDYENNINLVNSNSLGQLQNNSNVTYTTYAVGSCKAWKATDDFVQVSSDRKIKRVAKIESLPWFTKTEKMSISYKYKKRWGKWRWREHRTTMAVDITHSLSTSDCNNIVKNGSKGRNTLKKKKRRDIKMTEWGNGTLYAADDYGVRGTHWYYGTTSYYAISW